MKGCSSSLAKIEALYIVNSILCKVVDLQFARFVRDLPRTFSRIFPLNSSKNSAEFVRITRAAHTTLLEFSGRVSRFTEKPAIDLTMLKLQKQLHGGNKIRISPTTAFWCLRSYFHIQFHQKRAMPPSYSELSTAILLKKVLCRNKQMPWIASA